MTPIQRLGIALAAAAALHVAGPAARAADGDEGDDAPVVGDPPDAGDDGDNGDDAPAVGGPPSAGAARAEALFAAGRFGEAAPALRRVAAGEDGDGEERRQVAGYHLAIALYRLRFPHASHLAFAAIARARGHARRDEALPWLVKLAGELPEPAGVAEPIGAYGAAALSRFEAPAARPLRDELAYWLGRHAYDRRAFEEAAGLLEQVGPVSPRYAGAQILAGVAHVQQRRTVAAVAAFRRVVQVRRRADDVEGARLRDLALLSIGRTHYSASLHLGEIGAPTIDEAKLRAAVESYGRVEPWGAAWQEALFEQAWAHFMLGNYPRALGDLHSVDAPYFAGRVYPEADTLRAITSFVLCRYDDAEAIAARSLRRYGPARAALARLLAGFDGEGGEAGLLALLHDPRAGAASLPPAIRPLVEGALSSRDLERHREHLRSLGEEAARLRATPAGFRGSPLGAEVADGLSLAGDLAAHEASALVRGRLRRGLEDLDRHLDDARKILVNVAEARRDRRRAPAGDDAAGPSPALVVEEDGHVIWPFDGEYWRDEVGHYRQAVTSRCAR
jgi:tetratricopeptide (TPR) repeat protein